MNGGALAIYIGLFVALAIGMHVLCHFIYPVGYTPSALIVAALLLRKGA